MGKKSPKFSAPIIYVQPEYEELKRRFSSVNSDFCRIIIYPYNQMEVMEVLDDVRKSPTDVRRIEFEYVCLGHIASSLEAMDGIKRRVLRPALYEEFLGFNEKYPDEKTKHPIACLGSLATLNFGCEDVPNYHGFALMYRQELALNWIRASWGDDCRFLAVCKEEKLAA